MIYTHEERDFATCDIAGVYLHADMDDFTTTKLEVKMVDMMVKVDKIKYSRYMRYENERKGLYLNIPKELYRCIKSSLLWYNFFTSTLKKEGFGFNPYNLCVVNKTIDGKQCTIAWYVDNLKISHVESKLVNNIISISESHYGAMTITRGNKYVYICIDIKFIDDGKVTLNQRNHLEEYIEDFSKDVTTPVSSAPQKQLFHVDNFEKLDNEKCMRLHSISQKLLFI